MISEGWGSSLFQAGTTVHSHSNSRNDPAKLSHDQPRSINMWPQPARFVKMALPGRQRCRPNISCVVLLSAPHQANQQSKSFDMEVLSYHIATTEALLQETVVVLSMPTEASSCKCSSWTDGCIHCKHTLRPCTDVESSLAGTNKIEVVLIFNKVVHGFVFPPAPGLSGGLCCFGKFGLKQRARSDDGRAHLV